MGLLPKDSHPKITRDWIHCPLHLEDKSIQRTYRSRTPRFSTCDDHQSVRSRMSRSKRPLPSLTCATTGRRPLEGNLACPHVGHGPTTGSRRSSVPKTKPALVNWRPEAQHDESPLWSRQLRHRAPSNVESGDGSKCKNAPSCRRGKGRKGTLVYRDQEGSPSKPRKRHRLKRLGITETADIPGKISESLGMGSGTGSPAVTSGSVERAEGPVLVVRDVICHRLVLVREGPRTDWLCDAFTGQSAGPNVPGYCTSGSQRSA